MMDALNENSSTVRLNGLATDSDIDEQKGFKFIFAGAATGIRNPRGARRGSKWFSMSPDCGTGSAMGSIANRSTMTGVLNRVMVVVLLGCVGLTAGLAFGTLFSGNQSATSLFAGHG